MLFSKLLLSELYQRVQFFYILLLMIFLHIFQKLLLPIDYILFS